MTKRHSVFFYLYMGITLSSLFILSRWTCHIYRERETVAWVYARYVGSLFVPSVMDLFCWFFGGLYVSKVEL